MSTGLIEHHRPTHAATFAWEVWRRGGAVLMLTALVNTATPALLYFALQQHGMTRFAGEEFNIHLHIAWLACSVIMSCIVVCGVVGRASERYALPVAVHRLLLGPVIFAAAMGWWNCVLMTSFLNTVFDVAWPVGGPAMFSAVATVSAMSVWWVFSRSQVWLFLVVPPGIAVQGTWFVTRYGIWPWNKWMKSEPWMWEQLTGPEAGVMFGAMLVMYGLAVAGAKRDRSGQIPTLQQVVDWAESLIARFWFRSAAAWRSPVDALAWHEWRLRTASVPVIAFSLGAILFVAVVCGGIERQAFVEIATGLTFHLAFIAGLAGFFTGYRSTGGLGTYEATRPVNDRQFATAILLSIVRAVTIATVSWTGFAFAGLGWLRPDGSLDQPGLPWDQLRTQGVSMWTVPVFVWVGLWASTSVGASVGLTRRWFAITLVASTSGLTILMLVVTKFAIPESSQAAFVRGWLFAAGCLTTVAAVACVIAARSGRLIRTATVLFSAVVAAGTTLLLVHIFQFPHSVFGWMNAVALSVLPVVSLAATPLAIAWNRHR